MSRHDVVLLAAGSVTINEWGKEPERVPLRAYRQYDRFAAALGDALGQDVAIVEELSGEALERASLIVPGLDDLDDGDPTRALLLEATGTDLVHVTRRRMLGAVTWEAMNAWRANPRTSAKEAVFGRAAVAERIAGDVSLTRPRDGYAFLSSSEPVPRLVGGYLRASIATE
jgi:hypothetical protein